MKLKTEIVVFALFAAWAGWSAQGLDGGEQPSRRGRSRRGSSSSSAEVQEYLPLPAPDVTTALPPEGRDDFFSRDLFSPPSDTAPLPPLLLQLPPVEALTALSPPTAYGPGAAVAHLLRTPAEAALVPGLFAGDDGAGGTAPIDLDPVDTFAMTPEQRAARISALKRLHDWAEINGRLKFGQIRNKNRFDLARLNEEVLFVEIDPETGLELYPGQDPIPVERDAVGLFGLADTPANFIELRLREFKLPLGHGDFDEALKFAARCVELRNDTERALDVAEKVYQYVVEANPTDVRAPLGLAHCYELGFRFEQAFGAYKQMTEGRFKIEAQPWARLGDLMARFRLFERAEESYRQALRVRSTNWEARWRYGRFLLDRGRPEEAMEHLSEASKREPSQAELRWARVAIRADLASCHFELGQVERAHGLFEQARNADPGDDLGLAGVYSAAMFLPDAEQPDLVGAADDAPDASFDLLLALGLQGVHQGEWRIARRYLERAADADPFRAWEAWRGLSWLAEICDHPEEAYNFIERAYLAQPTDPWTLYQLGRLLVAQGDQPGAMRAFKAALDQDLDFADALIGLARLHQLAGDHEAAERYYQRALSIDGDRPVVHALRGFNHFQLNAADAAGDDFDRAISSDEQLASARNGQAWWFYVSGDSGEAMTRFGSVIDARRSAPENDPHRQYAVDQIARIQDHEGKEVWTDRFDRVGSIANAWSLDESDGIISSLRDGRVYLEGQFTRSGRGRVYQTLPAERFLSIEATVTIEEVKDASVLLFVSKEQAARTEGTRVSAQVALRRNRDGSLQATFIRKGQHEAEVIDLTDHFWPVGEPVRVRIATNGDSTDTRMSLWLNDLPVIEDIEVKSMGRSNTPLRFGVALEGEGGRSGKVSLDDVSVIRRK